MWTRHASLFKGVIGGIGGVAIALLLLHLWTDHRALHDLVDLVNANIAAQRADPAAPTPPAPETP